MTSIPTAYAGLQIRARCVDIDAENSRTFADVGTVLIDSNLTMILFRMIVKMILMGTASAQTLILAPTTVPTTMTATAFVHPRVVSPLVAGSNCKYCMQKHGILSLLLYY